MVRQGNSRNRARALCLAGSFLASLLSGAAARADIIPLADMLRGITMTPQQCAATPLTVWVNTSVGGYCMRYYLSTVGGEGRWPTVHLSGDKLGVGNLRTGKFKVRPEDKDVNTDALQRRADMFSKKTGGPAIYLARIGIDGSSGNHIVRHSVLELQVTNAALDGIKRRHQYEGFHLTGQSGGGTLVGGLLGLRQDIGCAVPGSGRLAPVTTPKRRSHADASRNHFDPSESVAKIARSHAQILVVTDPEDKTVPLSNQSTFVERLRRVGGQAEQFFVQATDENHHNTIPYSATAVAGCIRGENKEVIAQKLANQVRLVLAAAKAKTEKPIAEMTQQSLPSSPRPPVPPSVQTSQLPQQPAPPAYRQPPTSRPLVQTSQPTYAPTAQMGQPAYQQSPRPNDQASSPNAPIYPQQRQYQAGYPQYQQPPRTTYQAQAPTAQPIYPQQRQYQAGYPQYQQPSRPINSMPPQTSPSNLPPQGMTYQQKPIQPVSPHLGYASPPTVSQPSQISRPTTLHPAVKPAGQTQVPSAPAALPSQPPQDVEPGVTPSRQSRLGTS